MRGHRKDDHAGKDDEEHCFPRPAVLMPRNPGTAAVCNGALAGLGVLEAATRSTGTASAFHRIRALARKIQGPNLWSNDAQKALYLRQQMLDNLEGLIMRISFMLALLWREK